MEACLIFANSMILCWLFVWFCTGTTGFSKPVEQKGNEPEELGWGD